jgi:hypothetical protein
VTAQEDGFAAKQVGAPQAILRLRDEGQPLNNRKSAIGVLKMTAHTRSSDDPAVSTSHHQWPVKYPG